MEAEGLDAIRVLRILEDHVREGGPWLVTRSLFAPLGSREVIVRFNEKQHSFYVLGVSARRRRRRR